jgi:predicted RND superfamily exporter protein
MTREVELSLLQAALFVVVAIVALVLSPALREFWWQFILLGLLSIGIATVSAFGIAWRRGGRRRESDAGDL